MTDLDLNDFRSCLQLWQSIKWIKSIFLRTSPTTSRRSIQSSQSIKLMQLLKSSAFWKAYINCKKGENGGISGHRIQNWRWGVVSENHSPNLLNLAPSRKVWTKRCVCCFFFSVWEFLGVKFMLVEDSFQGGKVWPCRSWFGLVRLECRPLLLRLRHAYRILMKDLMGLLDFFLSCDICKWRCKNACFFFKS